MSHFTVLVIGDDVAEQLERYDENTSVEPYIKKRRDEAGKRRQAEIDKWKSVIEGPEHVQSKYRMEGVKERYKELCEMTDEQFYKEETGYNPNAVATGREDEEEYDASRFDADGNYLSTYNPDSKWDWYPTVS